MTEQEHLYLKLAEEGVEVALELSKRAQKTMLFGPDNVNVLNPTGPDNQQQLIDELNDLQAVTEMMADAGMLPSEWLCPKKIAAKKAKVKKFWKYAQDLQKPKEKTVGKDKAKLLAYVHEEIEDKWQEEECFLCCKKAIPVGKTKTEAALGLWKEGWRERTSNLYQAQGLLCKECIPKREKDESEWD